MGAIKKKKTGVILLTLLIIVLAGLTVKPPDKHSGLLQRGLFALSAPFQDALVTLFDGITGVWYGYISLIDARQEANDLQAINRVLQMRLTERQAQEQENARLRRLLDFAKRHPLSYFPARVIATDILGQFRTVTINAGRNQGIKVNAAVVESAGVVGRVVEVHGGYSKVLLMIDPHSSIDGLVRRTSSRGIIQGTNAEERLLCQLAFSLRTEDVQVGDEIITSGLDQQFPPDLPLGHIQDVSKSDQGIFQEATVKPQVDFTRLREVLVILPRGAIP